MYIPHVTFGNALCWANAGVIRSLCSHKEVIYSIKSDDVLQIGVSEWLFQLVVNVLFVLVCRR